VNRKRVILGAILLLPALVWGLVSLGQQPRNASELTYSGTIEAIQSNLAFQVGGRVQSVRVDEGCPAQEGEVLAVLDPSEFTALRDQAAANTLRAEQQVRQLETVLEINREVLPAEVERAAAAVGALRAQLQEAESGLRTQDVQRARLAAESTRVTLENARRDKQRYDELYARGVVPERARDTFALQFETALREHQRTLEAYAQAREGFRRETIETSRSRLAEGEASLQLARHNLRRIEAAERDVEAARAQVEAARATLRVAQVQLGHTELKAPYGGIILSRSVEPGEVVSPNQEVLALADLSTVDLKVFVGETEVGRVRPGQAVEVRIDTFPDRAYPGRVAYVSPQAEFTPKIIQTHKERVKLVYLVKVRVPNPDHELKSGMPADAWFR
jgi:HlyD family secretion protein